MDFIRTEATETAHAMTERLEDPAAIYNGKLRPKGKTLCGRTVHGRTGATIAFGIDCSNCKRVMRKEGWQV